MNGRAFLIVAQELSTGTTEAHWRAATGRAYYALMIECRDILAKWGFHPAPRENIHTFVRLRLTFAQDPDLTQIGRALDRLGQWRNHADYRLSVPGMFASPAAAITAIVMSQSFISLLDAIDIDPARRAAAIVSMRP